MQIHRPEVIPLPEKAKEAGEFTAAHSALIRPLSAPPAVVDDLFFECQLAHGSPTAKIRGVGGHKQLYEAIAAAFKLDPADVLYCTVNTYKPEMDRLLSSAIPLDCLLFAHVRGQKKEVVLRKEDGHLGLTITDNHAGHVFLKRVQPDSTCGRAAPAVAVGDLVECVNGESVVGKRHVEVARMLRALPVGQRSVLPFHSSSHSPLAASRSASCRRRRAASRRSASASAARPQLPAASGNQTVRFLADGRSVVQQEPVDKQLLAAINGIFEEYLGVHDDELALSIWELGRECSELLEMRDRLRQSAQLAPFEFPDELVFDMWGVVRDQKARKTAAHPPAAARHDVSVHPGRRLGRRHLRRINGFLPNTRLSMRMKLFEL
ncbi:hypothetical protein M3Y99_00172500 [Aphelenchoides fujianensis]|nr:hypothetical protein M3Y99_00172500 [Aphelenchoides fujianensis]